MINKIIYIPISFLFIVSASLLISSAYSLQFGITGYSGNPSTNGGVICNNCHSGAEDVTVTLEGPTNVNIGSINTYVLTLKKGQQIYNGGLGVSATEGTLVATDPNTQVIEGELTHLLSKTSLNGIVIFEFNWIAPDSPGNVIIYAAGNSVNGDFRPTGDKANKTNLAIVVQETDNSQIKSTLTVTQTVTSTITSTLPAETVTSTITIPPVTLTSTTTSTSEITETTGFPSEVTYAAIAVSVISVLAALAILIRKK